MKKTYFLIIAIFLVLFSACSPVKYVADGDFLLDDVKIDNKNTLYRRGIRTQYEFVRLSYHLDERKFPSNLAVLAFYGLFT